MELAMAEEGKGPRDCAEWQWTAIIVMKTDRKEGDWRLVLWKRLKGERTLEGRKGQLRWFCIAKVALRSLDGHFAVARCGRRGRSLRTDGTNIANGCNVRPKLTTSKWASSEVILSDSSRFCIRKYKSEVPF